MPYLLRSSTNNSYGSLTSSFGVGGTTGDYVEISAKAASGNPGESYRLTGISEGYNTLVELRSSSVVVRVLGNSIVFTSGYTQPAVGANFVFRATKTASGWECFLDGDSLGEVSSSSAVAEFDQLLNFAESDEAFQGDCYYIEACTDGTGVATNRWLNTTGAGSVWTDQIGSSDATLVRFPIDDSQWAFYSTGPNTPLNLSITNLQATSARLNWSQG